MKTTTSMCQERRRRGCLMLQAAIVMTSINIINASPSTGTLPSSSSIRMMDVPDMSGRDHTMSNYDHALLRKSHMTTNQGRRRRIMSKITSVRGGGPLDKVPLHKVKEANKVPLDKVPIDKVKKAIKAPLDKVPIDKVKEVIKKAVPDYDDTSVTYDIYPSPKLAKVRRKALNDHSDKLQGNKGIGGFIRSSPKLSMAVFIVDQTINVACSATVVSGFFGAWIASWMVIKAHKYLPTLLKNGIVGGESSNSHLGKYELPGKYRLTALASLGFLILHMGIQSNRNYTRLSDATFLAILWKYSQLVNPTLGGTIGCAHVGLSVLSIILGNRKLINALDHLGDIRLQELPQYNDQPDPYTASKWDRTPKVPIVTQEQDHKIGAAIGGAMGSASMLLSFPQYFLGLYMLGSTLVSCSSANQFDGMWKRFEKFAMWLSEEIYVNYDQNGKLDCGVESVDAGDAVHGCLNPWKVSKRLVAMYWIIALTKTAIAFVVGPGRLARLTGLI